MHIYYCSLLLKDVMLAFLIVLTTFLANQIKDKKTPIVNLFLILFPLTMMLFIRVPAFLMSVIILIVFFSLNIKKAVMYIPIFFTIGIVILLIYNNMVSRNISYYFFDSSLREFYLDQIYNMRSLKGFYSSIILWLLLPFGLVLPFPTWADCDIGKDITWLTASSIFFWNLLVIYVFVGLLISLFNKFRQNFIVYAPVIVFYLGTSLIYINTILDDRRKVMILPFAMLLASIGIKDWDYKFRRSVSTLYFISVIFLGFYYTYLRLDARGLW